MKKIILLTFFLSIAAMLAFANFEPSATYALSGTSSVTLVVQSEFSMSNCGTGEAYPMDTQLNTTNLASVATLTPNCLINSNDADGYKVTVKSTNSPAMVNTANSALFFTDLATNTPGEFTVGASEYKFGFTAYGDDVLPAFQTSASQNNCGSGGTALIESAADPKYLGFYTWDAGTTTAETSSAGYTNNKFVVCAVARKGASALITAGDYQASVVYTVTEK